MMRFAKDAQFTFMVMLVTLADAPACVAVPQHMTRTTQLEGYTQRIHFCNPRRSPQHPDAEQVLRREVLRHLFGVRVEFPENLKPADSAQEAVTTSTFVVLGWVTLTVTPHPVGDLAFFIEGRGAHIVINESRAEVVAKGRVALVDDGPHELAELDSGSITLKIREQNVLYSAELAPAHPATVEGSVFVRVYIRKWGDGIYSIDYQKPHDVGVHSDVLNRWPGEIFTVGHLYFNPPMAGYKLIDLRGSAAPWIASYSSADRDPERVSHRVYKWVSPPPWCQQ